MNKRKFMNIFKKLLPWILSILVILSIAAASKQLMGPTTPTTQFAIARWTDNTSYKLTNSAITIDNSGNMSGLSVLNGGTGTVTNGIVYLQQSSAPSAADIGGSVGVSTNVLVRNVNGILIKYWSDGTTVWSQEIGTH